MSPESVGSPPPEEPETTHFGEETVLKSDKQRRVRGVFDSVATRYDLMNDLMSGGVHRLWKDAMVDWLDPQPRRRVLDVAGGTGDVAERIVRKAARKGPAPSAVICDINFEMLHAGAERPQNSTVSPHIRRVCGDAEALPFPDRSMDIYTVAFGIRNMTDMDAALGEARRVLAPGGRFMCLEFSRPVSDALRSAYDLYSDRVIPRLGEIAAKDSASYEYLVQSIRRFPKQEDFAARIEAAGFSRVAFRNLTGGVAALHSAWRI